MYVKIPRLLSSMLGQSTESTKPVYIGVGVLLLHLQICFSK